MGFDPISFLLGSKAGGGGGGGGSSHWTKLAEQDFTVSTSSTSTESVGTIDLDGVAQSDILWVHIRDKAGKRNGYLYGSDGVLLSYEKRTIGMITTLYYDNDSYGSDIRSIGSAFGVALGTVKNGRATITSKYNSNYSKTIDGTYTVTVYKLTPPDGMIMFA